MLTAAIKLLDILARSLFVLVVLYALPVRASGQFGIGLTWVTLFAFVSGYERYLDVQRRVPGLPDGTADALVIATLRFFLLGYAMWIVPLALGLRSFADASLREIALWAAIAIGEHLSMEVYRLALMSARHRPLLWGGLTKNLTLLAMVGAHVTLNGYLELTVVLAWWAVLSAVGLCVYALQLWRLRAKDPAAAASGTPVPRIADQFRESRTHFMVGLVALGSLQVDRLIATTFLPLEQNGVYFRHVFLAVAAYQAAGILSHNRVLPRLYSNIRAGSPAIARTILLQERRRFVGLSLTLMAGVVALEQVKSAWPARLQSMDNGLLLILLAGYTLRGVADYNAIVLNASFREQVVLRAQASAALVAASAGVALIQVWSSVGLAVAAATGAVTYLLMTRPAAYKVLNASDCTT